ncbi:MAG: Flp family type IVb pilin [Massilia sp.]
MRKVASAIKSFIADETGVTAIEYGLIAALVGIAIVTAATDLGKQLITTFGKVVTALTPVP